MSRAENIAHWRKQFEKFSTEDLVAKRTIYGDGQDKSAAIDQILEFRRAQDSERKHSESLEALKASMRTGDTHINVGGDFEARSSNFGSVISEEKKPDNKQGDGWRHKIIPPVIAGIVLLIVAAAFRYYFPQFFPK